MDRPHVIASAVGARIHEPQVRGIRATRTFIPIRAADRPPYPNPARWKRPGLAQFRNLPSAVAEEDNNGHS